jgi:hypothetical protein
LDVEIANKNSVVEDHQSMKPTDSIICFHCKEPGHMAHECKLRWANNKRGLLHMDHGVAGRDMSECIAYLCATQSPAQAFFAIPDRPCETNARERVNMAIITMLKGYVTAKQIENEFQRILPFAWRWTTRKIADNIFTIRFPNAQLIKEWECFNSISMRIVKAKIQVEPWNGSIGAKGKLQDAWFRVRGVPYDKRSKETLAYVGSLVGRTLEVDKSTLSRTDYVRVRIGARDVSKVPEITEGSIGTYLYDLLYEKEAVMGEYKETQVVNVVADMGGQSSPKKFKRGENSSRGATQSEPQAKSTMVGQKNSSKQAPSHVNRLLSDSPQKFKQGETSSRGVSQLQS